MAGFEAIAKGESVKTAKGDLDVEFISPCKRYGVFSYKGNNDAPARVMLIPWNVDMAHLSDEDMLVRTIYSSTKSVGGHPVRTISTQTRIPVTWDWNKMRQDANVQSCQSEFTAATKKKIDDVVHPFFERNSGIVGHFEAEIFDVRMFVPGARAEFDDNLGLKAIDYISMGAEGLDDWYAVYRMELYGHNEKPREKVGVGYLVLRLQPDNPKHDIWLSQKPEFVLDPSRREVTTPLADVNIEKVMRVIREDQRRSPRSAFFSESDGVPRETEGLPQTTIKGILEHLKHLRMQYKKTSRGNE